MASSLDDFSELLRRVEKLRSEKDRAAGAYQQLMSRLKKEYGCKTLKQAKRLLARLRSEEDSARERCEKELAAFKARWPDLLS